MNGYLMLNNKKIDLTEEQIKEIKKSFAIGSVPLKNVKPGGVTKIGDLEFIVLEHFADNETAVLLKDFWKTAKFASDTNDYRSSCIREDLNGNFYRILSKAVGKENIIQHNVHLTADDGRNDYEFCTDYVSLLTCDLYRRYVYILDEYRPKHWWWLATAYSTKSNGYSHTVRCVYDDGTLYDYDCGIEVGVRPFCILKSNILVSEG